MGCEMKVYSPRGATETAAENTANCRPAKCSTEKRGKRREFQKKSTHAHQQQRASSTAFVASISCQYWRTHRRNKVGEARLVGHVQNGTFRLAADIDFEQRIGFDELFNDLDERRKVCAGLLEFRHRDQEVERLCCKYVPEKRAKVKRAGRTQHNSLHR